jgi:hypothetical protein
MIQFWTRKNQHEHIRGTFNEELYKRICEIKFNRKVMTPKEKAQELVDKMYHYQWREKQRAKECALIAVDLLLSEFYADDYYTQVKKEIEKL